jgi:hypothetical protein
MNTWAAPNEFGMPDKSDTASPGIMSIDASHATNLLVTWVAILEFVDDWYLLDSAKTLTDLLQDRETVQSPRIAAFIASCREQHPLDEAMLVHLVDFVALSDLRWYMSQVRAIGMEPGDTEVDWLRDLIVRLCDLMSAYEADLVPAHSRCGRP